LRAVAEEGRLRSGSGCGREAVVVRVGWSEDDTRLLFSFGCLATKHFLSNGLFEAQRSC